jgi:hypothetical protein
VTLVVGDTLPERLGVCVTLPVGDLVEDTDAVGVAEAADRVAVVEGVPSAEPVRVTEGDGDVLGERLLVILAERVTVPVPERDGEPEGEDVFVAIGVHDAAERVAVTVFDTLTEGEPEVVGDPDALTDPDILTVAEGLCVALTDADKLMVADALTEALAEPVELTVVVGLAVALTVGMAQAPAGSVMSNGPMIE